MSLFAASRTCVSTVSSAHSLAAFGPSPVFASPVVRVTETPPTETVVVACSVDVPGVADVITTSHVPVAPTAKQIWLTGEPGPDRMLTVQDVPAGAFTNPFPSPASTLMWQCNVWFVPTGFVAVSGVNWMFAST